MKFSDRLLKSTRYFDGNGSVLCPQMAKHADGLMGRDGGMSEVGREGGWLAGWLCVCTRVWGWMSVNGSLIFDIHNKII